MPTELWLRNMLSVHRWFHYFRLFLHHVFFWFLTITIWNLWITFRIDLLIFFHNSVVAPLNNIQNVFSKESNTHLFNAYLLHNVDAFSINEYKTSISTQLKNDFRSAIQFPNRTLANFLWWITWNFRFHMFYRCFRN